MVGRQDFLSSLLLMTESIQAKLMIEPIETAKVAKDLMGEKNVSFHVVAYSIAMVDISSNIKYSRSTISMIVRNGTSVILWCLSPLWI